MDQEGRGWVYLGSVHHRVRGDKGVGSGGQSEGQEEPLGLQPPLALWGRKPG